MSSHKPSVSRGFTVPELLVSIMVIVMISLAVVGDLNRTKYSEELQSSARGLVGALRNLQARALASSSIRTCMGPVWREVCEVSSETCVGSCNEDVPPYALGATLTQGASNMPLFAEVQFQENDRRQGSTESLGVLRFLEGYPGAGFVIIDRILTSQGEVTSTSLAFERQSGGLRIDACDSPPHTPICGPFGEPSWVEVTLRHTKTSLTRAIYINAFTGKISLD